MTGCREDLKVSDVMLFLRRRGEKLMKSSSGDIVDVFMYTDAEHTASVRVCV